MRPRNPEDAAWRDPGAVRDDECRADSAPNYNGAPIQQLLVVQLDEEGHRSLDLLRWD